MGFAILAGSVVILFGLYVSMIIYIRDLDEQVTGLIKREDKSDSRIDRRDDSHMLHSRRLKVLEELVFFQEEKLVAKKLIQEATELNPMLNYSIKQVGSRAVICVPATESGPVKLEFTTDDFECDYLCQLRKTRLEELEQSQKPSKKKTRKGSKK